MNYIDPPYGIKYGSNYQPFVKKRDVKDGKDKDLTADPELLARELLTESAICTVQTSGEDHYA